MFRSSWWPAGALSEMDDFTLALLTNDDVIRITMMSNGNRQVLDAVGRSFAGPGIVWTADDTAMPWKYVMLMNRANAVDRVAVSFTELGLTPATGCNVTDLWTGSQLGVAYAALEATLRPHASLLMRLSGCRELPHPPPTAPLPPGPPPPQAFCPADNASACIMALAVPGSSTGTCSADFEHVQPLSLPISVGTTMRIDAVHVDIQGNGLSDLHVVGLIYSDAAGAPSGLLAKTQPVVVPANASRAILRLAFAEPVSITSKAQGEVIWVGEQAGAPSGVPTRPGGPNSLACFLRPASAGSPPMDYCPQPYTQGPRPTFGSTTISTSSLSVFATFVNQRPGGRQTDN